MTDDFVSPYLNLPLRTKAQALRDMAAKRPDANKIEGMEYPEARVRANEDPFPKNESDENLCRSTLFLGKSRRTLALTNETFVCPQAPR